MSSSQVDESNHGHIVEAILRERYPPLYLPNYQSYRQSLLSTSPPMCVRNFDASKDQVMTSSQGLVTSQTQKSSVNDALPRLPGIGHLIMSDKVCPENLSSFDPCGVPMSWAENRREKLTTERDDADTDGSIPDLTEVIPPPRRKRQKQKNLEQAAISANATPDHADSPMVWILEE